MAALSDWQGYLAANTDLGAAGIKDQAGAQQHWDQFGQKEGRKGGYGAGSVTVGGQTYTADQAQNYFATHGADQVAKDAASLGLGASQVTQLRADSNMSIDPNNGYAPNIQLSGGTLSQQAIKDFFATNPNDQQILARASQLGMNTNQLAQAVNSAGLMFNNGDMTSIKENADGTSLYNNLMVDLWNGSTGYGQSTYNPLAGLPQNIVAGAGHQNVGTNGDTQWKEFGTSYGTGLNTAGGVNPYTAAGGSGYGTGLSKIGAGANGSTGGAGSGSSFSASSGTPQMNLAGLQGATNMGVDPATQTVAGQLQTVLANDSPLIQQARTRALQSQNANGRLNSTMSQSAADSAAYDAAMAIATPDANTYNLAAQTNAATANTFSRDANAYTRQQDMANFNVNANNWAAEQEAARQAVRDAALNAQGVTNSATATNNQMTAAQTAAANAERASATVAYNNARAEFASRVSAISMNDTMDANARTSAIESLRINYNSIIQNAATVLGWTGPDTWSIKGVDTSTAPTNASAPKASAPPVFNLDNMSGGA